MRSKTHQNQSKLFNFWSQKILGEDYSRNCFKSNLWQSSFAKLSFNSMKVSQVSSLPVSGNSSLSLFSQYFSRTAQLRLFNLDYFTKTTLLELRHHDYSTKVVVYKRNLSQTIKSTCHHLLADKSIFSIFRGRLLNLSVTRLGDFLYYLGEYF